MTDFENLLSKAKETLYDEPSIKEFFRLRELVKKDAEITYFIDEIKKHEKGMTLNVNNDDIYFNEKKD